MGLKICKCFVAHTCNLAIHLIHAIFLSCSDDGSCKHVVALLFACNSFTNRHIDRHTLTGTDRKCLWDKPKTESKPSEIDDLPFYEKSDLNLKHTYAPLKKKDCHLTNRELEKQVN